MDLQACDCAEEPRLRAEIRTSFTDKNLGRRFLGCSKWDPEQEVGHNVQLMVFNQSGEEGEGQEIILVNPKMNKTSKKTWLFEEGCLSFPEIYGDVVRPESITVDAQDINGARFKVNMSGLTARIFQHEFDNLQDVVFIATTRRILRPPKKGSAVQRPRNRTLTSIHEETIENVVMPAEIVGKRIRYRLDGSKIMKVFLDTKERNKIEYKLETFSVVYRKLSSKDVVSEFPVIEA